MEVVIELIIRSAYILYYFMLCVHGVYITYAIH